MMQAADGFIKIIIETIKRFFVTWSSEIMYSVFSLVRIWLARLIQFWSEEKLL